MLLTDYLLKESEKIWKEYYKHPFVQGIEKGFNLVTSIKRAKNILKEHYPII